MPRVPTRGRQVAPGGLPTVNVGSSVPSLGAASTGRESARAAQGANQEFSKFLANEKRKADDLAVMEFENTALKVKNELIYGKDGVSSTLKGEVLEGDFVGDQEKRLNDALDQVEDKFSRNTAQAALIAERRSGITRTHSQALQKHFFTQSEIYQKELTNETVKSKKEDGRVNYHVPEIIENNEQDIIGIRSAEKERDSHTDAWLENILDKDISDLHRGILESMINDNQTAMATEHLKNNKSKLTEDDRIAVTKSLEGASVRTEAQEHAVRIVSKFGTDLTAALAEVDKIKDQKVEDNTRIRVKQRIAEIDLGEKRRLNDLFDAAAKQAFETKSLDGIGQTVLDQFSFDQQQKLARIATKEPKKDLGVYYSLLDKLKSPDINVRKSVYNSNLYQHHQQLGDELFKDLANKAVAQRQRDANGSGVPTSILKDKQIQDQVIGDILKLNPNTKQARNPASQNGKRIAEFRTDYSLALERAIEQNNGRPIDTKEKIAIAEGLAIQTKTGRRLFEIDLSNKVSNPEFVVGGKRFDFEVKQIPEFDRQMVLEFLKNQPGRRVTEQSVKETWLLLRFGGIVKNAGR